MLGSWPKTLSPVSPKTLVGWEDSMVLLVVSYVDWLSLLCYVTCVYVCFIGLFLVCLVA